MTLLEVFNSFCRNNCPVCNSSIEILLQLENDRYLRSTLTLRNREYPIKFSSDLNLDTKFPNEIFITYDDVIQTKYKGASIYSYCSNKCYYVNIINFISNLKPSYYMSEVITLPNYRIENTFKDRSVFNSHKMIANFDRITTIIHIKSITWKIIYTSNYISPEDLNIENSNEDKLSKLLLLI